jgi:predicted DCC family thiol-disulfide oxidoreductase YuxK
MTSAPAPTSPAPVADPHPGKAVVLFDGDCPLCRRSVAILKRLDWLGRFAYQTAREPENLPPAEVRLDPKRLLEEMHVLTPDRQRAHAGYAAFRWIAWRLPAAIPLAPLMYVPGVPWLGNKLYLWIAKNRMSLVPCENGVCQIPGHRKTSPPR